MKLTNIDKIGLSTAVFLACDEYDYDPRPNCFSATTILKAPRQIVLSKRAQTSDIEMDISTLIASRFGSAIHDAIEKSWLGKRYITAMLKLGYANSMISRIKVVPADEPVLVFTKEQMDDPQRIIPVYMERRSDKELDGFIIRGKFDFVGDGELEDHKTTGVFTYMKKEFEKFRIQGSIYRWLNPDIITSDRMMINFTFTDWSKMRAKIEAKKGYPAKRMLTMPLIMMSIDETEKYLQGRIREIKANINKLEADLPLCTQAELWQDKTVYKYYKDPASRDRSTKNYDSFAEAQTRLLKDGSVGTIDIVRGEAKACLYCSAIGICSQAKQLITDGLLEI